MNEEEKRHLDRFDLINMIWYAIWAVGIVDVVIAVPWNDNGDDSPGNVCARNKSIPSGLIVYLFTVKGTLEPNVKRVKLSLFTNPT